MCCAIKRGGYSYYLFVFLVFNRYTTIIRARARATFSGVGDDNINGRSSVDASHRGFYGPPRVYFPSRSLFSPTRRIVFP